MDIKKIVIVKIVIVLVLFSLVVGVYINGKNLSCNKCVVEFESKQFNHVTFINETMLDLHDWLINKGECLVQWQPTGYLRLTDI